MTEIQNIFCNGDSFTAGVGLADHLIPGYLGSLTKKEYPRENSISLINQKNKFLQENWIDYSSAINYDENTKINFSKKELQGYVIAADNWKYIEKKYAWPNQYAKNNNARVFNFAEGGRSIESILHSTVYHMTDLERQGIKIDLAIIQVTSLFRTEFYTHKDVKSIKSTSNTTSDHIYSNATKEYFLIQDNRDLMVKYLYTLSTLSEYIKAKTGRYPLYIDSDFGKNLKKWTEALKESYRDLTDSHKIDLEHLINTSRIEKVNIDFLYNQLQEVEAPYENCGHYSKEVHKIASRKLPALIDDHLMDELFDKRILEIRKMDPFIYD